MDDYELPLEWVDHDLSGPIEAIDLDISQPEPGVVEGSAAILRRKETSDEFELRIDGELQESVAVEPSPVIRTGVESWRAITREEVSLSAEPGIGTFTVQFGGESQEIALLKPLPDRFSVYHENPNDDSVVGRDAQDQPTIRIGSGTDMFTTVNTFDSIYVDDGFENRKRVTTKVLPMEDYPGQDIDAGYEFVRQGLIVRNRIPNDRLNSGFVHLFHTPSLGEVRLQADFTGDGYTAYNDPKDGIFASVPIAADPPLWLRLERRGGTFRSYVSTADTDTPPPDSEWQLHRVETLPNVRPVQDTGMYGTHNNSKQVTATFDEFQRLKPLPEGWSEYHSPAANDGLAGVDPDGNLAVVTAQNTDLWATINEFDAIYWPDGFENGYAAQVRILPVNDYLAGQAGYEWARAGLIVRNNIPNDDRDSGYVHLYYTPTTGEVRLQADFTGDGMTTYNSPSEGVFAASPIPVDPPCWLRLERSGDTFTSYISGDGSERSPAERDWQRHREESLPNVRPVQDVGLYGSHNNVNRVTARFDGFEAGDQV